MEKFSFFKELTESSQDGTGKINPEHSKTMPYGEWWKTSDSYSHYRLLIAAAGCSDKEAPENYEAWGPLGEHPFSAPFSKADSDMLNLAKKLCGLESSPIATGGSEEPDHVHKTSPVNPSPHPKPWRKPNK